MSSVSFKSAPLFVCPSQELGSVGAQSTVGSDSKKDLHYGISRVFRRHVTDINKISPYESPAFSNYPGSSNLLYLPSDIYNSAKTLYRSIKDGDWEETQDASIRLVGAPANLLSAGGSIIEYGIGLHIIPATHILAGLASFTYIFGVVLCTVEGIVDFFSLRREMNFVAKFDLNLLTKMKKLLEDFNPIESPKALKEVTALFNENPQKFEELFGKRQIQQISELFNKIEREVEATPLHYRKVLRKYAPAISEVTRHLMIDNLSKLQREYLELTPNEVRAQCEKTAKEFENTSVPMEKQLEHLEEQLQSALNVKKKELARRVRPWMVDEANQKTVPILKGLMNNDPAALKEGLSFVKDIHIQTFKKTLVHVLGILALAIAAASIITLVVGCPVIIPYILIGIATAVGLLRMIAHTTTLDTRGWEIDLKALIPNFLKTKPQEIEEENPYEKFRLNSSVPLNQSYLKIKHHYQLNQEAMRV